MSRQGKKRKSPTFKYKEQSGILRVKAALNMTLTLENLLNSDNTGLLFFFQLFILYWSIAAAMKLKDAYSLEGKL